VDASRLPGSANARIRVEVSDGFNAGTDVSDAHFMVERKGPQAFILSPEGDRIIPLGTSLFLQGYAGDIEDGTLSDTSLHWKSNRDGDLGTGNQVWVTLSPGQHIISCSAIDSDGNTATASTNVYVGAKVYLPLILRNYSK